MRALRQYLLKNDLSFYFENPKGQVVAGLGDWFADIGDRPKKLKSALPWLETPGLQLGVSYSFEGEWHICLPRVLITGNKDQFSSSEILFDGSNIHLETKPFSLPPLEDCRKVKITPMRYEPNQEEWLRLLEMAKIALTDSELKKLVLLRRAFLKIEEGSKQDVALSLLDQPGNTYKILWQNNQLFFSRTPEKLLTWHSGHLHTEAIAGTRNRKVSSEELFDSPKDQYEHQLVVEFLIEKLKPFSSRVETGPQTLLELPQLVHLKTPIEAFDVDLDLLPNLIETVHPTPAVCGFTQDLSAAWLAQVEARPRGLFASALGVISKEACELAVGIRSGWISDTDLEVFTGVGVVDESQALEEWAELNTKLSQTLGALL